ncbi:hypothetical protein ACW2Q0_28245 [Nocardia sp. R16R-3T]
MAAPPMIVPAPTQTPARFGLQSAADMLADYAPHMRLGVAWEPPPCGPAHVDPAKCGDAPTDRDANLVDGIGLDTADPITVYAGFTCRSVGLTEQDIEARATAALATEWVAVEQAVWADTYLRLMRDEATPGADDPVNTPVLAEDPVNITRAVGLLEAFLGANYGGIGVIHAPREVAAHAATAQLVTESAGRLLTPLGNRYAFGSGYPNTGPDGTAAAAGTAWLVVTGAVNYRRSVVTSRRSTSPREYFDPADNSVRLVAERTYLVSWDDCVRAAVPVTLT